jgi:hypothetical protein
MFSEIDNISLINQYSGRYVEWSTQVSSVSSPNGTPTVNTSGIDTGNGVQFAKILISLNATSAEFRIWLQYEDRDVFYVVDESPRTISRSWTQEIDVSGVKRLYIEVTSISSGNADLHIGLARSSDS